MIRGYPMTKYGQTFGIPLTKYGVVDHHLVAKGNCHQTKGRQPKFIGSYFSLSVYDITANEMIDTCHSHLVANGNSLQVRGGGSISLV